MRHHLSRLPRLPRLARLAVVLTALPLALASPARAGQYLIGPGESWSDLSAKLHPGDEIILMPGVHQPGVLENVTGEGGRPIVIRGLTVEKPSIIEAQRDGIRLVGCSDVQIRDLTITGARINGIGIKGPAGAPTDEPFDADIGIRNVTVTNTGPSGKRHGIQLVGVAHVKIEGCTIRGWGGSGIDVDACARIDVRKCVFEGLPEHSQRSGVAIRGGSDRVRVDDSTFTDAGSFSIEVGGPGSSEITAPSIAALRIAGDKSAPLASRVHVMRCVFRGSACPLHFFAAHRSSARNNTIHRPRQWALAVDVESPDAPPVPSARLSFGANLVAWSTGDLRRLVRVGEGYRAPVLSLEENLWWSPMALAEQSDLGKWPEIPAFPQLRDLDPSLDDALRPTVTAAETFGAWSP